MQNLSFSVRFQQTWSYPFLFFFIFLCRVEEAYKSVQKRQKALLDEWKNSCNSTLKWIADSSARVQAQDKTAQDLDHARAQRQEIEVRKEELVAVFF